MTRACVMLTYRAGTVEHGTEETITLPVSSVVSVSAVPRGQCQGGRSRMRRSGKQRQVKDDITITFNEITSICVSAAS